MVNTNTKSFRPFWVMVRDLEDNRASQVHHIDAHSLDEARVIAMERDIYNVNNELIAVVSSNDMATNPVDPLQAISFALSLGDDHDAIAFLQDWNEGVYWADYLAVINSNRES